MKQNNIGLIIIFSIGLVLVLSMNASAQQWNGPDGNGNITTANSGKVGIGATAFDSWDTSIFKVLGLNTNSGFTIAAGSTSGNALHITDRAYFNGTAWKYSASSTPAANYYQGSGVHGFRVAPGGAAGDNVNWSTGLFINNSANVGIGTTSPNPMAVPGSSYGRVLTVANPTAGARALLELWTNAAPTSGQPIGQISFLSGSSPSTGPAAAILSTSNGSVANSGDLEFYTSSSNGGTTQRMVIAPTGNVGIGVATPTVALDVLGDIKATGTIFAKYQDLAEWVPSSEKLSAGMVVVLDSTKSNQVVSSTVSYDTRVAGVISAQPGITLGEQSEDKVLVATTGRVKVKVDASRAPIHIGDLLVTSDLPGVAMKSEPIIIQGRKIHAPGTLIGKALEPLAKGKGEILVLLSLQ